LRYEAAVLETTIKEPISFETGDLSEEDIQAIPDNLPVDSTFVDKNDPVRYFS
jgi:DUF438 domain-containing protein